jgi:hypothetical protein
MITTLQFHSIYHCRSRSVPTDKRLAHRKRWAVKKFPEFPSSLHSLTSTGGPWVRTAWTVLLVISSCKFYRGCAKHFGGNGVTSAHRLLCSREKHSCHHPITVLPRSRSEWLLVVPCSEKWALRGHVLQPWRTSDRMRWPNSGRFQTKPSAGASNSVRIDGASVCVSVCARAQWSYIEGD